jgi:glutathione reductase (NADPH)
MSQRYDYVVIGGGSGGIATARRAAEYGAQVALVESHRLGGTCVNVGCVPKKLMWNAAGLAHALDDARGYGFELTVHGHDWPRLKAARDAYVARLNGIYEQNLANSGVDLYRGRARLVDAHTVVVPTATGEIELSAPQLTIAVGGRPQVPPLPGAELGITSDGFFELAERPARVAIVGSGYVAVELGGAFAALGSQVALFARHDRVLRSFDTMLSEALMIELARAGIELVTHAVILPTP